MTLFVTGLLAAMEEFMSCFRMIQTSKKVMQMLLNHIQLEMTLSFCAITIYFFNDTGIILKHDVDSSMAANELLSKRVISNHKGIF